LGHVARMRDEKYIQNFGLKTWRVRDHSEDLVADGKIILEWILEKYRRNLWSRVIWLKIGPSDRLLCTQ